MADTTFTAGTVIASTWLNEVNDTVYGQPYNVMRSGAVADGTTDNTSTILTAAGISGVKTLMIPPNVKYNRKTLLQSLPVGVVLLDMSSINDFVSAGETTKHVGIVSSDTGVSDTHWSVDSGHHSVIALNNYGTAGTTSASERKGSIIWNHGQFALGATDKRGFRGVAIQQFTKDTGNTFWVWTLRSLAPMLAGAGEYEEWATGQTISGAGVYRYSGSNHYVSTGAGTTGATAPTHNVGTVSDGAVSWTWLDSIDRTVIGIDQHNRVGIGPFGSYSETFTQKVGITDPSSGTYTFNGRAGGLSKNAVLKLTPTNATQAPLPNTRTDQGTEVAQPYFQASVADGLTVMKSDGSTAIATFSDSGGLATKEIANTSVSVTSGTSISASGVGTVLLNYGSPATITAITGGSDDQILTVICQTANLTFTNSATFLLAGSVNLVTPAAWSVIMFKKIPTSISDRWIEISRSLK